MPSKPYTVVEICALQVLYQRNKQIVIVSDQRTRAETVLSQIRETVLSVPERLRTRVTRDNKRQIEFDNGCTVRATTEIEMRGLSVSLIVVANPISDRFRETLEQCYGSRKHLPKGLPLWLEIDEPQVDVEAFAKELLDTDKTILENLAK